MAQPAAGYLARQRCAQRRGAGACAAPSSARLGTDLSPLSSTAGRAARALQGACPRGAAMWARGRAFRYRETGPALGRGWRLWSAAGAGARAGLAATGDGSFTAGTGQGPARRRGADLPRLSDPLAPRIGGARAGSISAAGGARARSGDCARRPDGAARASSGRLQMGGYSGTCKTAHNHVPASFLTASPGPAHYPWPKSEEFPWLHGP